MVSRHITVLILSFLGLVFGTYLTVTLKIMYQLHSVGSDGQSHVFHKPLCMEMVLFFAISLALPIHCIWEKRHGRTVRMPARRDILVLCGVSILDMLATVLFNYGLLCLSMSIHQLLRAAIVPLSAILRIAVFGRAKSPSQRQWVSLIIVGIALGMVTFAGEKGSSEENDRSSTGKISLGVLLVLAGALTQASQYVFEELSMSNTVVSDRTSTSLQTRRPVPPLLVIGFEGLWGMLLNAVFVLPIAYAVNGDDLGHAENAYDAWVQISNSAALQGYVFGRIVVVLGFNICIIFINALGGAVQKALIAACRPVFVWSFELLLYYCITNRAFGHKWNNWSWLQLAGMILLIGGCLRYSLEATQNKNSHGCNSKKLDSEQQCEPLLPSNGYCDEDE